MKNNKGFSLIEIMVSLPIALTVLGAVGAAIIAFYSMSSRTKENISTDQELNLMLNSLRTAARLGINVRWANTSGGGLRNTGSQPSGGEGYVLNNFTYSQFTHLNGPAPLMYFNRETAQSGTSAPRATALFFVPPTANTPGQLQLTLANTAGALTLSPCLATGPCTANPPPSVILNNVVGVRLYDNQNSPVYRMMNSVKLGITVRSFIANSDKPRRYCPQADWAASCADGGPYRDFERIVVLQFDNNRQDSMNAGFDLPYGVYFFRPAGPRWSN
ncbi:hypothetical protein AZI86_16155 [Bdellovibrio bacteriovorus]|uniref:Prepilin-type N-terminal cleavage/methylation domain-containing protein n=1 Tax=Bdellovibrio bacteriovorus TaxID=959 RepID=A0A150WH35_BDEBC|nr:prepilin-type N-terminal cleavage/methylation domain-containing protein [Bdellovibrio bacteriovorus]KYG62369.1 hypothetical protein AZI86_16155 [Bdellovibrio bacteriovorus]